MKLKFYLCFLLLTGIVFLPSGIAQNSSVDEQKKTTEDILIPNEVIVRLQENIHANEIVKSVPESYDLQIDRLLSAPTNIWLLNFDDTQVSVETVVRDLNNLQGVLVSQPNTYVELRAAPNDQFYSNQWHHQNIDSEDAWDITTGGTTASGDDIVVCIIESANVMGHPDLAGNHWTNTAEVADGTDTDGNGYIDDVNGWNVNTNNDNIGTGAHGTQVAGMIGAVGDNTIGVAGANWDVKMMVVAGHNPFDQANIIEAYTYPLEARLLWNSTDGAQGAFVVATNASWGIDGGDPSNYPIWCGFYDDLGQAGILNCGATTNSNSNVDVVGDMPTGCASDYMVGVTATNMNDFSSTGYGVNTIDVAAPGLGVYTTNSTGYGTTSGTSFASPLTAGVIGLMYAAPCDSFMTFVKNDPQGAADLVRQSLFDGVDQTTHLMGRVITGGRINANTSMDILMDAACIVYDDDLGIIDITQPENGTLSSSETIEVTIRNFGLNAQSNFDVTYQIDGGTVITETYTGTIAPETNDTFVFNTTADFGIIGQTYTIEASTNLTDDENPGNDAFTKEVKHLEADDLGVTALISPESGTGLTNDETITIEITNFGGATQSNFDVTYTIDGGASVTETVPGPIATGETISYSFTQTGDFSAIADYEVFITTLLAGDADPSNDSLTETVMNSPCMPESNCSEGDGLTKFVLEEINANPIACTTTGYIYYTGETATLDAQIGNYTATIRSGYGNNVFSAWIDYNDNGVFEASEQIFSNVPVSTPNTDVQVPITIPSNVLNGQHLMRVRGKWNQGAGSLNNTCADLEWGKTVDFLVNVINGVLNANDHIVNLADFVVVSRDNKLFEAILTTNQVITDEVTIKVFNVLGQEITSGIIENNNGEYRYNLDMKNSASGVYLVRVGTNSFGKVKRIITR